MSSPVIRPVQIKNAQAPFQARKLPAWAPPGQQALFNAKRMGQKKLAGSFSVEAVPVSLAAGLGGAGAILIGAKLPSPWNAVLIGGGLAALGFGIYNLFTGETKDAGEKGESEAQRLASEDAFKAITGAFRTPKMYEQIDSPGPDWLFTANYFDVDVVFVVTNPSATPIDVTLKFTQTETATRMMYGGSVNKATYFKAVTIPAKTSLPVSLQIDTLNWTGALTETIVAEKIRGDEAPVKLSEVTFFV